LEELLGRIMSLFALLFVAGQAIGSLVIGALFAPFGVPAATLVGASLCGLVAWHVSRQRGPYVSESVRSASRRCVRRNFLF